MLGAPRRLEGCFITLKTMVSGPERGRVRSHLKYDWRRLGPKSILGGQADARFEKGLDQ